MEIFLFNSILDTPHFPMRWSTFSSFIFIDQADIILGLKGWFSLLHGPLTGVRGIHMCIRFFFPLMISIAPF